MPESLRLGIGGSGPEPTPRTRLTGSDAAWSYECPVCYSTFAPEDLPADGRCFCEDSPKLREKQSEFGAGVVVCLVKFSEHLWTNRDAVIPELAAVVEGRMKPEKLSEDAKKKVEWERTHKWSHKHADPTIAALEDAISMWASAAGDHLFELDDKAPQPLKDLAAHVITMRNGHLGSGWHYVTGDWTKVRKLWEASALALDTQLGVKANWGSW